MQNWENNTVDKIQKKIQKMQKLLTLALDYNIYIDKPLDVFILCKVNCMIWWHTAIG